MVARPTKRFQSFDDISENKKFLRIFTSRVIPITTWLPDINHNIKCPFHDDSTASARIYHDKDCVRLYCYSCGRQYTSADYIDLILGKSIKDFLESKFDKKTLDMMVRSSGEFEIKVESFPIQDYLGELEVSLESFLRKVYKC